MWELISHWVLWSVLLLGALFAIYWFGEAPDPIKAVGFTFVWAGLLVSLLLLHRLKRRSQRHTAIGL